MLEINSVPQKAVLRLNSTSLSLTQYFMIFFQLIQHRKCFQLSTNKWQTG